MSELKITMRMRIEAKIRARKAWVRDQCREAQWNAECARTTIGDTHRAISETTLEPVAHLQYALTKAFRSI